MQEIHQIFEDNIYPKTKDKPRIRHAVRGIIINDKKQIALIHIKGVDKFGYRDHYELPGGGIEPGEDEQLALRREMHEEIGYLIDEIKPIGIIGIEYNILERIDYQHFYCAKLQSYVGQVLIDYEKELFTEVVFIALDEIENFYQSHQADGIGKTIQERDLYAIKYGLHLHNY